MKLLRFGAKGLEKPGLLDADGQIRDLSGHVADIAGEALLPRSLALLAALDPNDLPIVPAVPQGDIRLGPCVGGTRKFICIGLNYADHAAETGAAIPAEPVIFTSGSPPFADPMMMSRSLAVP